MDYSSLTPKEKHTIRSTNNVRVRKTANSLMESNTEAKVFLRSRTERTSCSKLVDDSMSIIFLGRLVDEMGCTFSWELGQKPSSRRGQYVIQCHLQKINPLVAVTKRTSNSAPALRESLLKSGASPRVPQTTTRKSRDWPGTAHRNLVDDKAATIRTSEKVGSTPPGHEEIHSANS